MENITFRSVYNGSFSPLEDNASTSNIIVILQSFNRICGNCSKLNRGRRVIKPQETSWKNSKYFHQSGRRFPWVSSLGDRLIDHGH